MWFEVTIFTAACALISNKEDDLWSSWSRGTTPLKGTTPPPPPQGNRIFKGTTAEKNLTLMRGRGGVAKKWKEIVLCNIHSLFQLYHRYSYTVGIRSLYTHLIIYTTKLCKNQLQISPTNTSLGNYCFCTMDRECLTSSQYYANFLFVKISQVKKWCFYIKVKLLLWLIFIHLFML